MRLIALGGSAASPNAGAGCAGFLVETRRARIVLDLSPGTLPELRRHADFRTLDGIVISHLHLDHVLDLLALRHALAYNPLRAASPLSVWLPPGGARLIERAAAPFDECDAPGVFASTIRIGEYEPDRPLAIGDAVLSFAPTVHDVPGCAIRLRAPGAADLAYTGDTGPAAGLEGFFAGAGVVIAEATLRQPGSRPFRDRGSLTAAEAGALASAARAEILVLTHVWQEFGLDTSRDQAAATFRSRLEVARPGLTIEW